MRCLGPKGAKSNLYAVCFFYIEFLWKIPTASIQQDVLHFLLLPRYSRTNRVQCPKFPIFIFKSDLNWFKFELFQDYEEKFHNSFPGMIFSSFFS